MYDSLNEELRILREKVQLQQRCATRIASCQSELRERRAEAEALQLELARHELVLEKLNGLSMTHLIAMIGRMEDKKERELNRAIARVKPT